MKKAIIITFENYQDHEVIYPYYRLIEEGFDVSIMSSKIGRINGILGTHMQSDQNVKALKDKQLFEKYLHECDLMIIPGGVTSTWEKLRQEEQVLNFINEFDKRSKTIGCICHGVQIIISAKITNDRNVSGYYTLKDDINNSGARFVDAPCVISNNLVTSPHYKYNTEWMKGVLEVYRSRAQ